MESADLSKKKKRMWPGLGPNVFEVDYGALFEEYKEFKQSPDRSETPQATQPPAGKGAAPVEDKSLNAVNQLSQDIEVSHTEFHKAIIRARNDYYTQFKGRFEDSIRRTMSSFNEFRAEEIAFNNYWNSNLKEITAKHI